MEVTKEVGEREMASFVHDRPNPDELLKRISTKYIKIFIVNLTNYFLTRIQCGWTVTILVDIFSDGDFFESYNVICLGPYGSKM